MAVTKCARRRLRVLLGALFFITSAGSAAGGQQSPATVDTVGRAVDRLFARWDDADAPGAAVGVFRDGRLVYAEGYGSAHLEWAAPITPSTVFHVASLSKQFTAFAIALLAERGMLSLDDDVGKHLPWVPDFGATITLRHLLHHTSGLRDQWTLLRMAGRRLDDVIVQEDVLDLVRRQRELNFQPGKEFLYSNTGYTLLVEVVERVTGRPFGVWMRENIFDPLGMSRTRFQGDHELVVEERAESYQRGEEGRFRRHVLSFATVGATGLLTTVQDLARWVAHLDDPGAASEGIRGARGAVRRMEEPGTLSGGEAIGYALGQVAGRYRGLRTLEHAGGDAGFRSHLLRFPDERFAVAVLANLAEIDAGRLARRGADLYLSEVAEPAGSPGGEGAVAGAANPDARAAGEARPPSGLDPWELERVAGRYWSPASGEIREVRGVGGRLLYGRSPEESVELLPLGKGRFRLAVRAGGERSSGSVEVRFEPSDAKAEHLLVLAGRGMPAVYRAVEPWSPSPAELREYAGDYWSEELGVAYSLRVADGILRVRQPRGEEIPIAPAVPDAFISAEPWLARVRFLRDRDGCLAGFRASSARVRELLFVRLR